VPRDDEAPPVPAGAYNVAAQLLAVEAGVDSAPPWARVHLAAGRWLTLRAARLEGDPPPAERDIAVTIEESSPTERMSLFARCAGLSVRETELLGHLATGADTRDVAERMFLSAHTVQDHLKSVFDKTGARSRRALLARALGS
jgi:DNA-binding CsgD family transcriptional regulator